MTDPRSTPWLAIVLLMVLVVVLYVLSVGPMYGLLQAEYIREDTFYTLYWPVHQVMRQSDTILHILNRYAEFFDFTEQGSPTPP